MAIAAGGFVVYQVLLLNVPEFVRHVKVFREGGPAASVLAWAVLPVLATVITEMYLCDRKAAFFWRCSAIVGVLILSAVSLHFWVAAADRIVVSAAYVLTGGAAATILFVFFEFNVNLTFVRRIGRHPLFAWILQGVIYVPVYLTIGRRYFTGLEGAAAAASATLVVWLLTETLISRGVSLKL